MRQRKWWWAIFVWLLGVSTTNGYVIYKRVREAAGVTPLSHREFIEAVVADLSARIVANRATRKNRVIPLGCAGSKRKRTSDASSVSSSSSSKTEHRSPKITSAFLDNCGRLNRMLDHKLEELHSTHSKRCQYCNWKCQKKSYTRAYVRCTSCDVNLCLTCWSEFHGI